MRMATSVFKERIFLCLFASNDVAVEVSSQTDEYTHDATSARAIYSQVKGEEGRIKIDADMSWGDEMSVVLEILVMCE